MSGGRLRLSDQTLFVTTVVSIFTTAPASSAGYYRDPLSSRASSPQPALLMTDQDGLPRRSSQRERRWARGLGKAELGCHPSFSNADRSQQQRFQFGGARVVFERRSKTSSGQERLQLKMVARRAGGLRKVSG
jgi:hypothetical protein